MNAIPYQVCPPGQHQCEVTGIKIILCSEIFSLSGDRCVLRAGPLTQSDEGAWSCILVAQSGAFKGVVTRREVAIPELMVAPSTDITVAAGGLVSWSCGANVTLTKAPVMYWTVGRQGLLLGLSSCASTYFCTTLAKPY